MGWVEGARSVGRGGYIHVGLPKARERADSLLYGKFLLSLSVFVGFYLYISLSNSSATHKTI